MSTTVFAQQDRTISLPRPRTGEEGGLIAALRARRSTREFSSRPLSPELLSTLLWAAFGVNRPATGGRTAPSAHGWQEIDVYVCLPSATYRYEASRHALTLAVARDLRALTGTQDFVATAPLDLVYVADFSRMTGASAEERAFFAATDAAVIAENVYLFCAASGLATVVRGLVDRKRLAPALGLRPDERIVLGQTVGFPVSG